MVPLLSAVLAVATAAAPCFIPADQSPGWKVVSLPEDAPSLAAPPDVEQFRTGERVTAFQANGAEYGGRYGSLGREEFTFNVPPGTFKLEVEFAESLRGAKVDASGYSAVRHLPLLHERRVAGDALSLTWETPDFTVVTVTVHHHTRPAPVLRRWRVTRAMVVTADAWAAVPRDAPPLLYFRHPGGRLLELCQDAEQLQAVDLAGLNGRPVATTLRRKR